MGKVRVIEIHENVFKDNNTAADRVREKLIKKGTCMINVMSSPGSGKTTLLTALINNLKDKLNIAVMDVDIETSLDAERVAGKTGVRALQIHNGGLCHIDAEMTEKALTEFESEFNGKAFAEAESDCTGKTCAEPERDFKGNDAYPDLIFLENIGNLVCPAEFDTGAHKKMMLFSVPEGDDKPLKYPLMFSICDLIVISKTDTADFFDFDFDKALKNIRGLNKNARVIRVSAKTGEGIEELSEYILETVKEIKNDGKR